MEQNVLPAFLAESRWPCISLVQMIWHDTDLSEEATDVNETT